MIDVDHASFSYVESTRGPSIEDVSFRIQAGDRVLVIGHNGCGKSTLLSLLGGRRKPSRGVVRVMERDPFDDLALAAHISLVGMPWPPEAYFANTVDRVTSPAPLPERRDALAAALHLRLTRAIDKMSSGEKRRVQILHAMLHDASVYLLDECSTDIDVAERRTVLNFVRSECEARGGCCLYATHILDRVGDWATHLLMMEAGRVVRFIAVDELPTSLEQYAFDFMAKRRATRMAFASAPAGTSTERALDARPFGDADRAACAVGGRRDEDVVIQCANVSYKDVFSQLSLRVYRGERVLLAGCNGAGKSTLLNMLGGKQFFQNSDGAMRVLGKACYEDMTLNASVAYGGDWWVAVPGGEVHVHEMLHATTPRARHLVELLSVDLQWDVRHLSAGERRRVQLLLFLLEDKPIVLLDEATAELDVDQRHQLLQFLFEESTQRGVTVVYSTHIFGGLEGWANTVVILDRTKRGVHAVWREAEQGGAIDLDALTEELVQLKCRETF